MKSTSIHALAIIAGAVAFAGCGSSTEDLSSVEPSPVAAPRDAVDERAGEMEEVEEGARLNADGRCEITSTLGAPADFGLVARQDLTVLPGCKVEKGPITYITRAEFRALGGAAETPPDPASGEEVNQAFCDRVHAEVNAYWNGIDVCTGAKSWARVDLKNCGLNGNMYSAHNDTGTCATPFLPPLLCPPVNLSSQGCSTVNHSHDTSLPSGFGRYGKEGWWNIWGYASFGMKATAKEYCWASLGTSKECTFNITDTNAPQGPKYSQFCTKSSVSCTF